MNQSIRILKEQSSNHERHRHSVNGIIDGLTAFYVGPRPGEAVGAMVKRPVKNKTFFL